MSLYCAIVKFYQVVDADLMKELDDFLHDPLEEYFYRRDVHIKELSDPTTILLLSSDEKAPAYTMMDMFKYERLLVHSKIKCASYTGIYDPSNPPMLVD